MSVPVPVPVELPQSLRFCDTKVNAISATGTQKDAARIVNTMGSKLMACATKLDAVVTIVDRSNEEAEKIRQNSRN